MRTPCIFLCYSPRGPGLRCALAYVPAGHDARGWFTGPGDGRLHSAYFVLEGYYTSHRPSYREVADDDLHSRWTEDEAMCHELARLQDAFVNEWLFYPGEPGAAIHLAGYARDEIAVGEVAIRHERLARLDKDQPNWVYYSPECEEGVIKAVSRYWPLDYRPGT